MDSRFLNWVWALLVECIAFILVVLALPLTWIRSYQRPTQGTGRPILLVPGYVNNSSVWFYQRWKLSRGGLGPIYTMNYGHPFRSLHHYAKLVKEKAEQIEQETGSRELAIIGHSMGGVVAALYATRLAPPGKVTHLIAIASPLKGTAMACLGCGPNAREMRSDSSLIQQLHLQNPPFRFYQIATKNDELIRPYTSSLMGHHPERQLILQGIGHTALPYSGKVADKMISWLKKYET